ncbi:mitochondrial porin family protein [Spirosoma arcticum]
MKTQATVLAVCLLSVGVATAQTTTNSSSTGSTTTNSTYGTTPATTDVNSTSGTNSTYGTSPSSLSNGSGSTMSNGTMNSNGSTTNGTGVGTTGSTTTNSMTSPAYGTTTTTTTDAYNTTGTTRTKSGKDYKNFVFGVYAGLNTTKFKGEDVDTEGDLSGRLGYQLGFFVRGGGRLYGQIGAEYFASSSNYFTTGSGQSAQNIQDQINIKYIQVPVYIGYKLVESDRGISAVRLQVGLEYANQIGSDANQFGDLDGFRVKSGTFNGLGQLGFDAGPIFLDLTYHYGFSDAVSGTGFNGSQRRIASASVGFKF